MHPLKKLCAAAAMFLSSGAAVLAQDLCFDHNGSLMRLVERGGRFTLFYEEPREVLRKAGVIRGTVLANGISTDGGMTGVARRFSRHCRGRPLEYDVSGYFENDETFILSGERPVYERCQPTGRHTVDELLFTYVRDC